MSAKIIFYPVQYIDRKCAPGYDSRTGGNCASKIVFVNKSFKKILFLLLFASAHGCNNNTLQHAY